MTKKTLKDHYSAREAKKYDDPIASREFIIAILSEQKQPLTREAISQLVGINGDKQEEALRRRLHAMERDGQLLRNRKQAYGVVSKMNLVTGKVMGHPDGFGFLIPDDASDDLFLSHHEMRLVLHGDQAIARVTGINKRNRKEGAIVDVIKRANQRIVGRLFTDAGADYVIPNNRRINQDMLIPPDGLMGAKNGQIVEIDITRQPHRHRPPIGKIVAILGDHLAPGMEVNIALRTFDLPHIWLPSTLKQAESLGDRIPTSATNNRLDLRALPLVTIDGEGARDFDDAVHAELLPSGSWRLWVAIADVSYYVQPDSELDKEAEKRGTSVYFPNQVIPMLPKALSHGLCSLKPHVDRLCIACEAIINKEGEIESYQFHRAVMQSKARLTYTHVANMLTANDAKLMRQYQKIVPHLNTMYDLYQAMTKAQHRRGAIEFELPDTHFIFDKNKKIQSIKPRERNDAHRLIESFMITANVCAARFLLTHKLPICFRIHEAPSGEKLSNLHDCLKELGLSLAGGTKPKPIHYTSLLKEVRQKSDDYLLQTIMLSSMKQAVYHPDNVGHFGLALDAYTHFTSPIRRYADLLVHRAICHLIATEKQVKWRYSHDDMLKLSAHCSMTSRRADEATRDVANWLKCEYMQQHVGEVYNGIISGVTGFGLFVELKGIHIEGLVHITALKNDYYQFDAVHHKLTGERNRQVYQLGDALSVKVIEVNLEDKKIDLAIL